MEQSIVEGICLFNRGRFFEAHEALEAEWLKAEKPRNVLLHGLIQVAAAFHHYGRQNPAGFRSLLEKGCAKLETFGAEAEGLNVAGLRSELRMWQEYLNGTSERTLPAPPLPQIQLLPSSQESGYASKD
jgi:predicted metal-dependent hydrolase